MKLPLCVVFILLLVAFGEATKTFHVNRVFRGNWYKAYHYCYTHGMKLAKITSQAENDNLIKQINESGISDGNFYISATSVNNDGHFYWMGHSASMSFANWAAGEPNNVLGDEYCVHMRKEFGYKWNDSPCYYVQYFVCEQE